MAVKVHVVISDDNYDGLEPIAVFVSDLEARAWLVKMKNDEIQALMDADMSEDPDNFDRTDYNEFYTIDDILDRTNYNIVEVDFQPSNS